MESRLESQNLPHRDFINVQDRSPERLKTAVPVLISPGWSENPVVFEDTISELVKLGRRVIAVGYSGIRESKSVPNQPSLEVGKAEAILDLLKTRNLTQVDVVAHSEGSIAAIIAASVEPGRFRSLILVDPAGFIGKDDFPKLAGRFSKKVIHDHFRLLFGGPRKPLARFLKEGAKFAVTHPAQGLKEAVAISKTQLENLLGELRTSGVKVAIVSGVDDPVFPMKRLQQVVKANMIDGFLSVRGGHDEIHLQPKYARAIEKLITDINKVSIPLPDTEDHEKFEAWLDRYITAEHYHNGFDDMTHPDGTPYSMEERVEGTKEQCRAYLREGIQLKQHSPEKFSVHQTAEMIRKFVEQIHADTT